MPQDDLDERSLPSRLGGVVFGVLLGALFGGPLGFMFGIRGWGLILFMLAATFVAGYAINWITTVVPEGTAKAFLYLIWPSGQSAPYEHTYSNEQALAARGDIAGALAAYEEAIRLRPMDPEPRLQAAELYLKSPTPERAAQYLAAARRLSPKNRARELYATQRLIDLYWGKLQDHPRARAELRQLMSRFPGTREATAAQKLLETLNEEVPK